MPSINSEYRYVLGQEVFGQGSCVCGHRGIVQCATLFSASQLKCGLDRKKLLFSNSPENFAQ